MDAMKVQNAANIELLEIANQNGFDLNNYELEKTFKL